MSEDALADRVEGIFRHVIDSHVETFKGEPSHREWPLWYAERVVGELSAVLGNDFTTSELVYLIVQATEEQSLRAPGSDAAKYYAQFLTRRFS